MRRFVVGRVLTHDGDTQVTSGLDYVTTYYLLHRNDFGMGDAPAGACILYAISCNLSDRELTAPYDVLSRGGRPAGGEAGAAGAVGRAEHERDALGWRVVSVFFDRNMRKKP